MSGLAYHRADDGVVVATPGVRLKVSALGEHVIRVRGTARADCSRASPPERTMLVAGLEHTAPAVEEQADALVLSTAHLHLRIDAATGAFTWTDTDGTLLVREPHDGAPTHVLREIDVLRSVFDEAARASMRESTDGLKAVVAPTGTVVDRTAYSTTVRLEFAEGEVLYGLGQHEEGLLDHRGHHQYLYQQNMKIAAPVLVSSRGYALIWNTESLSAFHDDQDGTYFWTETDDELDFLMLAGPELDDVVRQIRRLTGEAPMVPRWALGYVQSKDRYSTAEELVAIVDEFRRRHLGLDVIVQDWQSWPEGLWGQKSFDPERYPDPAGLLDALHARDARLLVSIWPNMAGDGDNQRDFADHDQLLGDGSTYDAFDPKAGDRYWDQANEGYFRYGVDGFWADCTEPFEGDWRGAVKPEPHQRLAINTGELKKYLDPERMNAYSLQHSGSMYDGQRRSGSDKRVLMLTRSGYPGQQRYGTVTWSGDTSATWGTLRRQVADGLNLAMTGTPYWTVDIGAYFVEPGPEWFWYGDFPDGADDLGYRELYVRWLQLGTFLPMFRSHGRSTPREPWRFGDEGDATYDTIKAFIALRYRLLPYLYSLAGWTTHRAYTPLRSLAFDFRRDPAALRVDDQFMLGPALLVCPVSAPMRFGPSSTPLSGVAETRSVYLPAGCDWYDFWTGERFAGGRTIDAPAPLERVPLFVRAGTILPLGPDVEHSGQDPFGPLEIRVYPGADGQFDLYEDAGDGYDYERGESSLIGLRWSDVDGRLTVEERSGAFTGMPARRTLVPVRVASGAGLGAATPDPRAAVAYDGDGLDVSLP